MTRIVGKFFCSLASNGDQRTSFSFFDPFHGINTVWVMRWFIKKVSVHSQSINSVIF